MDKKSRIIILLLILWVMSIFITILIYEAKYNYGIVVIKNYTPQELREKIKSLPNYQGDSLLISTDGKITSKDPLIQSVIHQMYAVPANNESIKNAAANMGEPMGYLIYKTAMQYYVAPQKADEVNKDTLQ